MEMSPNSSKKKYLIGDFFIIFPAQPRGNVCDFTDQVLELFFTSIYETYLQLKELGFTIVHGQVIIVDVNLQ